MYARQQKARLVRQRKRLEVVSQPVKGLNRRTISLLPDRKFAQAELLLTGKTGIYQQLLTMEVDRVSCCIKITSPKFKARAAIIIYQGRVLGCVYGSKKIANQLFGRQAFERIMMDITRSDSRIDGYMLSEQMVLAAGSVFHEQVIRAENAETSLDVLVKAIKQLEDKEADGCVVITNEQNSPLSIMFFSGRELLGCQLLTDENVPQDLDKAIGYLTRHPECKVYASMITNGGEVARSLTFGLSGLNEPGSKANALEPCEGYEASKLTLLHAMRPPKPVCTSRFVNVNKIGARSSIHARITQRFNGIGWYHVDPT